MHFGSLFDIFFDVVCLFIHTSCVHLTMVVSARDLTDELVHTSRIRKKGNALAEYIVVKYLHGSSLLQFQHLLGHMSTVGPANRRSVISNR